MIESLTADPTTMLKSAGLRVTAPRVSVLRTLAAHPHATADVLVGRVRAELGSVSTQAVYDILHALPPRASHAGSNRPDRRPCSRCASVTTTTT